ncbi:hypothetical protein G7046_g2918 [Stylonectria norvegica]|nr:hypothetical protein G7046_g2918 [Stylonectria norvegica]
MENSNSNTTGGANGSAQSAQGNGVVFHSVNWGGKAQGADVVSQSTTEKMGATKRRSAVPDVAEHIKELLAKEQKGTTGDW